PPTNWPDRNRGPSGAAPYAEPRHGPSKDVGAVTQEELVRVDLLDVAVVIRVQVGQIPRVGRRQAVGAREGGVVCGVDLPVTGRIAEQAVQAQPRRRGGR